MRFNLSFVQHYCIGFIDLILSHKLYFILCLEDWHSLILVSKGVSSVIKKKFIFNFGLDDQWVYNVIWLHGHHALYHANTPFRAERIFQIVGYPSDKLEICVVCKSNAYHGFLKSPIIYAISDGSVDYLRKILEVYHSSNYDDEYDLLSATLENFDLEKARLMLPYFKKHDLSDVDILAYAVLGAREHKGNCAQIIEFVELMGISINSVDEHGNNVLMARIGYFGINDSYLVKDMYKCGLNVATKNNEGKDVIDICTDMLDQDAFVSGADYDAEEELKVLGSLDTFKNDERLSRLLSRLNILHA